jgi:hypothetical protein
MAQTTTTTTKEQAKGTDRDRLTIKLGDILRVTIASDGDGDGKQVDATITPPTTTAGTADS